MRIADITMFHAPVSGGVKTYLNAKRRFIDAHSDITHDLLVPGARSRQEQTVHYVASPPLPFGQGYRFPLRRKVWRDTLLELQPDIIEAGDPYVTAWAALEAGHRLKVPVVGFYHSDVPRLMGTLFGRWATPLAEAYVRRLYRRFDRVLVPSRYMVEGLRRTGLDNVHLQPLGVDLDTFHPGRRDSGLRDRLGLTGDTRLLVFIGRAGPEKNIGQLLEVARRLGHGYHLLLIGSHMPTRVPDNVTVLDYMPADEAAGWLASSDAMLHAGTAETFGLVALEAMASGIPVVASRAGALAEIIPVGCGLLCEPHSSEDMAARVCDLFTSDPLAMGRRARQHVERHYGWAVVMETLLGHYRELTGQWPAAEARCYG
ncbi:MAG TPA: glycoside hydrolase [Marinobacter sp.]|nr:glycoside hydrolase [Marinobacter sp.]